MYVGELMLMGGVLFKLGSGWPFVAILGPFAIVDLLIILVSGGITYGIMAILERKKETYL